MSHRSSAGYIESIGSSRKKTKEDLQVEQLIPSEILDYAGEEGIQRLLKKYYEFMNMKEFKYTENETFTDIILDGQVQLRISDPNNENDEFFTDETGASSTLIIDNDGTNVTIPLSSTNIVISNGNELPGTLAESTSEIGKTFTVNGLSAYNGKTATLTTPIVNWIGPGPSYTLNNIEQAGDIDLNEEKYLQLLQKEIAPLIPRNITVDKRTLYKRIIDFYKVRGSSDSIEIFFRLLFNEEAEIEKPYDKTLIPSNGNWDSSINQFVSRKGFVSEESIRLHDSYRYQKYSYLIKTAKNLTDWKNVFNRLVHPAGFIFFGEILILLNAIRSVLGDDTRSTTLRYTGNALYSSIDQADPIEVSKVNATQDQEGKIFQTLKVYDRVNRLTLSSMPGTTPGVIGAEDLPLLVEMLASIFTPTAEAKIHKSAVLSGSLNALNQISDIEIIDPGYGYASAPTITITGDGSSGAATATLDSEGRIDSITITNAGTGYTNVGVAAAANNNATKISRIKFPGVANKTYRRPPQIVIGAPTAVDEDGNPAPTNVQATAQFDLEAVGLEIIKVTNTGSGYTSIPTVTISAPLSGTTAIGQAVINDDGQVDGIRLLNAGSGYTRPPTITISGGGGSGALAEAFLLPAEIDSINITNVGFGYVSDPRVTLGSNAVSERRAKNINPILILLLNHLADASDADPNNNYFNLKGNSYYNSSKKFGLNQTIETVGNQIIQNSYIDDINRYNISSYITQE